MQYGSDGIKIRREAETMYQKLMTCLESVREKTDFKPEIGLPQLSQFVQSSVVRKQLVAQTCFFQCANHWQTQRKAGNRFAQSNLSSID